MASLGGAATFANYLDSAASGDGGTNALMKWFQFTDGNTYIVVDNSATTTFADGVDSVVQLVGLIDLSTSATVTDVLTIATV
jgi:S-layer protein